MANTVHNHYHRPRSYGCMSLLLDVFLTLVTSGLWIIWIIIREIRRGSR